jgi:hypothetical protein
VFDDKRNSEDVVMLTKTLVVIMNESLFSMKNRCPQEEFDAYKRAIGGIMAEIYIRLLDPIYFKYPELKPSD